MNMIGQFEYKHAYLTSALWNDLFTREIEKNNFGPLYNSWTIYLSPYPICGDWDALTQTIPGVITSQYRC